MKLHSATHHTLRIDPREFLQAGLTFNRIAETICGIAPAPESSRPRKLSCARTEHGCLDVPLYDIWNDKPILILIEEALKAELAHPKETGVAPTDGEEKLWGIIEEQLGLESLNETQRQLGLCELGADSLDIVEIEMAIEMEFGVDIPHTVFSIQSTTNEIWKWVQENAEEP